MTTLRRHRSAHRSFVIALLLAACAGSGAAGCTPTSPELSAEPDPLTTLPRDGKVPTVLRYGVTPSAGADTAEQLGPLLDHLSRELKIPVQGVTATNYDNLEERFRAGEIDVGQFSPAVYVEARANLPGVMIATATNGGSPTYMSYLMVRNVDAAKPLLAFRGKRVAWVHRSSTSGYVYPRRLLCDRGHAPDSFFLSPAVFTGDHATSAAALRNGTVDVAAVASNFVDQDGVSGPIGQVDELAVIAKSSRIPLDGVVVHNSLSHAFGERLRDALVRVSQNPNVSNALTRSWGINGFIPAREGHYDNVAKVMASQFDQCP